MIQNNVSSNHFRNHIFSIHKGWEFVDEIVTLGNSFDQKLFCIHQDILTCCSSLELLLDSRYPTVSYTIFKFLSSTMEDSQILYFFEIFVFLMRLFTDRHFATYFNFIYKKMYTVFVDPLQRNKKSKNVVFETIFEHFKLKICSFFYSDLNRTTDSRLLQNTPESTFNIIGRCSGKQVIIIHPILPSEFFGNLDHLQFALSFLNRDNEKIC